MTRIQSILVYSRKPLSGLTSRSTRYVSSQTIPAGTLTFNPERQSAHMSKITNEGLTWSGT